MVSHLRAWTEEEVAWEQQQLPLREQTQLLLRQAGGPGGSVLLLQGEERAQALRQLHALVQHTLEVAWPERERWQREGWQALQEQQHRLKQYQAQVLQVVQRMQAAASQALMPQVQAAAVLPAQPGLQYLQAVQWQQQPLTPDRVLQQATQVAVP